ncbi:rhodanese-like domain-containing protein [Chitinimonas sp. BJYL2]|uniref:rhodanese-like domain-containing protein n=1 Tax=Chitinimonas sp. BJYL2 TaxID=2976696 RepID=UPI0022B2E119|nr:rhodanese-like domain-containing protein [Chitinimonas sp. BJYL2]
MNWLKKLMTTLNPPPPAIPDNAILIDVRSPGEYASGHVEGALNLPLDTIQFQIGTQVPDKTTPLVLYCMSGMRSGSAGAMLQQLGYTQIINGGSAGAVSMQTGRHIVRS